MHIKFNKCIVLSVKYKIFNLDNLTVYGVKEENGSLLDVSGEKEKEEMEVDEPP